MGGSGALYGAAFRRHDPLRRIGRWPLIEAASRKPETVPHSAWSGPRPLSAEGLPPKVEPVGGVVSIAAGRADTRPMGPSGGPGGAAGGDEACRSAGPAGNGEAHRFAIRVDPDTGRSPDLAPSADAMGPCRSGEGGAETMRRCPAFGKGVTNSISSGGRDRPIALTPRSSRCA